MLAIVAHFIFIFVQWHSNAFQTNSNSMCVSIDIYNCTFVYILLILFIPFLFEPIVFSLNGVYVNTQLQHTCTKWESKAKHSTPSSIDDDADDNDADADAAADDGADDDDNDFLFLCEIHVVITMPEREHMQVLSQQCESLLKYLPNTFIRY